MDDGGNGTDHHADDGAEYDHADPDHAGGIHHVELYAADLDASVPFWDWLLGELGYDPKNEFEGGRSWVDGPTYVVLVEAPASDPPFDRRAPGLNHLAFHAGSRELVDDLSAGVREREDATLLYGDRHPYAGGYYALYCEDPAGIKVEVIGPRSDPDDR
ncbi:glyoxalase [Halobacteriales archaeon QS_8_69_26]|nr:MAG: glyoxalase [Halobacteriales archaeon QS_8_69_26]